MSRVDPIQLEGYSAFATVFCTCGWLLYYCEDGGMVCTNPECERYGRIVRVEVNVFAVINHEELPRA